MHTSILSTLLLLLSANATAQDDSATHDAANDEHEVTPVDSTRTTGIYVGGFEASILYPCSEPGQQWWMRMNPEFPSAIVPLWSVMSLGIADRTYWLA